MSEYGTPVEAGAGDGEPTRGLSQQQIARIADMPRATWANLESGAANPALSVLVKVAQALQVRRRS